MANPHRLALLRAIYNPHVLPGAGYGHIKALELFNGDQPVIKMNEESNALHCKHQHVVFCRREELDKSFGLLRGHSAPRATESNPRGSLERSYRVKPA